MVLSLVLLCVLEAPVVGSVGPYQLSGPEHDRLAGITILGMQLCANQLVPDVLSSGMGSKAILGHAEVHRSRVSGINDMGHHWDDVEFFTINRTQ